MHWVGGLLFIEVIHLEPRLRLCTKSRLSEANEESPKPLQPAQPSNMIMSNLVKRERVRERKWKAQEEKEAWWKQKEREGCVCVVRKFCENLSPTCLSPKTWPACLWMDDGKYRNDRIKLEYLSWNTLLKAIRGVSSVNSWKHLIWLSINVILTYFY